MNGDTGSTGAHASGPRGIASAGHPLTAAAATEILADGGNAFDAMIAALWMACVSEPVLASPGGGGFMLVRSGATGETRIHDFFAHTPGRKRPDAETDFYGITVDFGVAQQDFHVGLGAAAVPGFVRGVFAVHRDHGTLPMTRLVEPAVRAARDGLIVSEFQAYALQVVGPIYKITQPAMEIFCRPPAPGETAPVLRQGGDSIVHADLAGTLEALGREGDALFYEGEIAAEIDRVCREGGGHLRREDLASYRDRRRAPLVHPYREATIHTNSPPASGGLLIAHSLELLARSGDVGSLGFQSPDHVERVARVMAATNRARAACMPNGDSNPELLEDALLARYVAEVQGHFASHRGTTHISVLDRDGNAASATVSNGEGCGHMVKGTGFMLNNMLGEEDINPRGLGAWIPDQRMSSMMAPTLLALPRGAFAVVGSGGSNRIRTAILQVLVNTVDFGKSPIEAVTAPRMHLEGEHLDFEGVLPDDAQARLAETHPDHLAWPARNMFFGGVHMVMRTEDGALVGAGDPRRSGVCESA